MITSVLDPERGHPLCIEPEREDEPLLTFLRDNRASIGDLVEQHGAVLLRGFSGSPEDFGPTVEVLEPQLLSYVHGNSPRTRVSSANVYTSTEYPAELPIPLHNELSYAHRWPRRLYFHCVTAPTERGQTPIAESREVLLGLSDPIRRRFAEKGLMYEQCLHGGIGLGRSWQDTYETPDRHIVEGYLREAEVSFSWTAEGGLRTRQVRQATVVHPELGVEVWFNQADQWHWSNAGLDRGAEMCELLGEDNLPTGCRHGDGSPIDLADLEEIRRVYRGAAILFDWRDGDMLVIDNVRMAHGREPFVGARRVLVAMG